MIGLKREYHLDRATNFISWKSRVIILEEKYLLKLVNENVREPDVEKDKSYWKKSDSRVRRILVDSVKDHLVSHILQKETTRKMFKTLTKWWLLMAKPDLYGRQHSNVVHYTPLVVGVGPPQCQWAPTNTLVVHTDHWGCIMEGILSPPMIEVRLV